MNCDTYHHDYRALARDIRKLSLEMAYHARSSHSGGALSMADLLAVLYGGDFIRITPETVDDPLRDRFILSKGHCCASLYATLALCGYLDADDLRQHYGDNGTLYYTHCSNQLKGVEISTGSLGHGLPAALGMALAAERAPRKYSVYCLTGDGELDEGSCWESILYAGAHKMSNLCLIVDYNKLQSMGDVKEIMDLEPLGDKLSTFRWNVIEIDGHDTDAIAEAYRNFIKEQERPTAIIANTIKGKGVSFMENNIFWHYHNPNDQELKQAEEELG